MRLLVTHRHFITDRVSGQGTAIGRVRPSARLFPLQLLNRLTLDIDFFVCVYGS